MSVWFMFDCHIFHPLHGKPVDQAMEELEGCVDRERGYGFMSRSGEPKHIDIRPGTKWRAEARKMLNRERRWSWLKFL